MIFDIFQVELEHYDEVYKKLSALNFKKAVWQGGGGTLHLLHKILRGRNSRKKYTQKHVKVIPIVWLTEWLQSKNTYDKNCSQEVYSWT